LDISSNGLCGIVGHAGRSRTKASQAPGQAADCADACLSLIIRAVQENNVVNMLDVSDNAIGRVGADEGAHIVGLVSVGYK
jgi:hypothetical protein